MESGCSHAESCLVKKQSIAPLRHVFANGSGLNRSLPRNGHLPPSAAAASLFFGIFVLEYWARHIGIYLAPNRLLPGQQVAHACLAHFHLAGYATACAMHMLRAYLRTVGIWGQTMYIACKQRRLMA